MGAAGLLHDPGVACRPRRGDRSTRADYAMAGAAWALPGASADRGLDVADLDLRVDNGRDRLPDVLPALCASGGCSPFSETSLEIDTQFVDAQGVSTSIRRHARQPRGGAPSSLVCSCSSCAGRTSRHARLRDHHIHRGLPAVPGRADDRQVHPAMVRRDCGGMDHFPPFFSNDPARRLRLLARCRHEARGAPTGDRTSDSGRRMRRDYGDACAVLENAHHAGGKLETGGPGFSGFAHPVPAVRQYRPAVFRPLGHSAAAPGLVCAGSPGHLAVQIVFAFQSRLVACAAVVPIRGRAELDLEGAGGRVEHQARRRAPAKRRERQHGRERKQQPQRPPATARVRRPPYIFWIALPACASLLLYAATNEMTHDVAPIPFLWVVPLALYLLSFIICFDNERWYKRGIFHPALALAVFFGLLVRFASFDDSSLLMRLAAPSVLLFAVCMVCHGELARLKPDQRRLTAFYLMVSAGGAIGGIFAVMIAPLIFPGYWEYSLAIWLCPVLLFMVLVRDPKSWIHEYNTVPALLLLSAALALPGLFDYYPFASTRLYIVSASAFVGLIARLACWKKHRFLSRPGVLYRFSMSAELFFLGAILVSDPILNAPLMLTRNFYGVFDVSLAPDDEQPKYPAYQLTNGGILHGSQSFAPEWRYRPVTYYGPSSGIGVLMINDPRRAAADSKKSSIRVGGVGLGIGTIAAWGSSGDSFRFYEINPAIIKLAT